MSDEDTDAPYDENGRPLCARPCQDGEPCIRQVQIAGLSCHLHEDDQPILPLPEPTPTYDCRAPGEESEEC